MHLTHIVTRVRAVEHRPLGTTVVVLQGEHGGPLTGLSVEATLRPGADNPFRLGQRVGLTIDLDDAPAGLALSEDSGYVTTSLVRRKETTP